jgi:hypothetical protein
MAKISDLTSTTPGRGWYAPLLDAADTTLAATGTDKRATLSSILGLIQASDLPTVLFAGDGFTAVSNTTTATSLFGGGNVRRGSRTIPANTVQAGSRIALLMTGHYSLTGTVTVIFTVKLGSTTISVSSSASVSTGPTNAPWYTECPVGLFAGAGGASGTLWVQPTLLRLLSTVGTAAGNATPLMSMATPQTAYSVDWTASQTLDVTVTMGTASASNTFTLDAAHMLLY